MAKKEEVIAIEKISPKTMIVTIAGDGDLICNKMNDVTVRTLTEIRNDKAKKAVTKVNKWEEIITAVHWRDGKPASDPDTWNENTMAEMLTNNAPCISAFGLMKAFGQAVVRFGIDTYATKFNAAVNIVSVGGVIPFKFEEWTLDEKLMSPKKGSPVLSRQNRFTGWKADIVINYIDNIYSAEQIVNIINLAGFGLGIGSGRSSGFGRFHVDTAK